MKEAQQNKRTIVLGKKNMANYDGYGRSNYVKVKDLDKFKELCNTYGLMFVDDGERVGFLADEGEPNSFVYGKEIGDEKELPYFLDEFAKLLEDEEVLIWMHVGHEKLRYLVGYTVAINNKGETHKIDINDIHEQALILGKNVTQCTY